MSQSRFSIVLVGVSALLRRPLVSRLRPADGERSPWVVFAARVGRFDSGFRWAGWPSGSLLPLFGTHRFGDCRWASWPSGSQLPLFGMHRFGVAAGRVRSSAFRFGDSPRRVGLRTHGFRFSARTASEIAIWRVGLWAHRFGNSARRVGLRVHCFRFSARTDSEWLLGEFVLPPSVSEIVLGGLVFGLTASAFRHAPLRSGRRAGWPSGSLLPLFGTHRFGVTTRRVGASARRVGSSAFRFGDCRSVGWPSGSPLPLFGMHRFGVALGELVLLPSASEIAARRVGLRAHASGLPSASWFCRLPFRRLPLGGLAFGLTASAFRHAPLRRLPLGGLAFGLTASAFRHAPLRGCPRRVGLRAHDFRFRHAPLRSCPRRVDLRAHRFRFSARTDPHRRTAEARADGAHRHDTCFTSKHLSQHVNLPHRSPQALQNRQTPLLSPTRHPRGRRPHAHHRAHREEVHPGFGRREGRGRRT